MRSKEYDEGYISFKKNKGSYVNPYPTGTNQRIDFERGWTQAIRKEPASCFKNGKYYLADRESPYKKTSSQRIQLRAYSKK